jgi:hypothetical protein
MWGMICQEICRSNKAVKHAGAAISVAMAVNMSGAALRSITRDSTTIEATNHEQ